MPDCRPLKTMLWSLTEATGPVAEAIRAESICDLKIVFGTATAGFENVRQFYFGNFPEIPYQKIPDALYDTVYECMPMYIDMMDRHNKFSERNYHDYVNLFNRLFNYFYWEIKTHGIEQVVFTSPPHEGADYLLYNVARAMGCRLLFLYQSQIPNRFFYVTNLDDFGTFRSVVPLSEFELKEVKKKHDQPVYHVHHRGQFKYSLKKAFFQDLLKKKRVGVLLYHRRYRRYHRELEKSMVVDVDFEKNYVYFPLHFQPEMTTTILGGIYNDQLLAIERLSKMLPEGWKIYVKEYPIQSHEMRGDWFFARLRALPNVQMVSLAIPSAKLAQHCRFVATISGTAGWEALAGGKNVVVFGRPWYLQFPGVFPYHSELKVEEILNYRIDHHALEQAFSELYAKSAEGVVDDDYIGFLDAFDAAENGKTVARSLQCILQALNEAGRNTVAKSMGEGVYSELH